MISLDFTPNIVKSPRTIAFLEAAALAIYISLFAFLSQRARDWIHVGAFNPTLSITLFLLIFVISALISGFLILGYPIFLFSSGKKKEAAQIVAWSIIWLIVFLSVFALGLILVK